MLTTVKSGLPETPLSAVGLTIHITDLPEIQSIRKLGLDLGYFSHFLVQWALEDTDEQFITNIISQVAVSEEVDEISLILTRYLEQFGEHFRDFIFDGIRVCSISQPTSIKDVDTVLYPDGYLGIVFNVREYIH